MIYDNFSTQRPRIVFSRPISFEKYILVRCQNRELGPTAFAKVTHKSILHNVFEETIYSAWNYSGNPLNLNIKIWQ